MQATIDTKALHKILSVLVKGVPSKTPIPILENFLIETKEGVVYVTSFDLENRLTAVVNTIMISGDDISFAVPAKILTTLLSTMPEGEMTIEHNAGENTMSCTWGNGSSVLPVFDSIDFPQSNFTEQNAKSVTFAQSFMRSAISKTSTAVGDDDKLRNVLSGILFDVKSNGSNFVASDRQMLVCIDSPVVGDLKFILPNKSASIIKALLEKNGDVTVKYDGSSAVFEFGQYQITSVTINAKYPDYRKVIPANNPHVMVVEREKLCAAVRRVMVCANSTSKMIRFKMSFNEAEITGEDLMFGITAKETLPCEYDGQDMEIGFKAPALHTLLDNMESKSVEIKFMESNRATLIVPSAEDAKDEPIVSVIMPMMIS